MDNNYLYILGILAFLLVLFIVLYYLNYKKKFHNKLDTNKCKKDENDFKKDEIDFKKDENNDIECDGEKCYIRPKI